MTNIGNRTKPRKLELLAGIAGAVLLCSMFWVGVVTTVEWITG